jgi:DNA-binding phage protein
MAKSRRLGSAGRRAIIFDQDDVYRMLRAAIEREGGQTAFANRHHIDRGRLNKVLKRKARPGDAVAKALGLRRVYVAE